MQNKAIHTTKKIIDKHINYVNEIIEKINPEIITVQGGEIGHVPEYILEYFFERLNRPIDISTNGTFLKREFHKNKFIRPYINRIMLHITDVIGCDELEINYDITDPDIEISIGIVDISKDPKKIKEFLEVNKKIYFDYIDYETAIDGGDLKVFPSYNDLYESIKDLSNVSEFAKQRILNRYKRGKDLSTNQQMCMSLHPCVFIDLVRETIPLCIRNYTTVTMPLNKENLISVIGDVGVFDYNNNVCKNCFRICQDDGVGISQIKNKSRYKEKLSDG